MSDSSSSENEDCEGLLKRALVVNFTSDFNPASIPRDGHEYLQHVIHERNKCKKLVIADVDPNKFNKNQTFRITLETPIGKTPGECLPTIEWQNNKLENFKCFRKFIESKRTSEPSVTSFNEESFIIKVEKEVPTFSQFLKFSQCAKIRMLELINKYLGTLKATENIEDNVGTWIFAILVSLEIPLSPSNCHVIREFAKKCLYIRSNLPSDKQKNSFVPLNFYVCIISRYFNQLDLAD